MHSDNLKLIELPNTDELACSDDIPVDNEDQNFLPNILLFLLNSIWASRTDWFFGVDMAIYHTTGANPRVPVVPDGFLSLGVERKKGGKSRRSYAVWEEDDIVPILTLEIVSYTPGNEYDDKLEIYRKLGVLYYIIYNPEYWQRDQHQPLSVYKLVDGNYELQIKEPLWLPEIGLGIGRHQGEIGGIEQEFLSWYDESGNRYLMPEEIAIQQKLKAQAEEERAERLAQYLRSKGIDPDNLPDN
ncbi:MAG: Uma2 family endonuclease [Cyanobacteria bacterium J06649_11]